MMTYDRLAGRIAVVTCAAGGMGAATARLLAGHGAAVALLAPRADRPDRLDGLAAELVADGGRALAISADVTGMQSVTAALDRVHSAFGRVELVVNAAGGLPPEPVVDGRMDEWARAVDTRLMGALRMIHAFVPDLVAVAAEGRTADLVTITTTGARLPYDPGSAAEIVRAVLTRLSATLRAELGPKGVRVTSLEPGFPDIGLGDGPERMLDPPALMSPGEIADLVAHVTSRPLPTAGL
jgi:NAD(P)-dependent dehydrogenase (short-subunit alcohol dehydrogenase family)